jgi:6-pyruvoyltetrahydropterin/6-carboxytetrahydropterin synthase
MNARPATERELPDRVTVVRKARFAAAHFLALPELSEAENARRFGPSSNLLAHGHNYEVEIRVTGPVEPDTGMVVNLKDLKAILNDEVVTPLDFRNLNRQVPFFADRLPTLENLARFLWHGVKEDGLKARIDALALELTGLRVLESADLYVDYFGGAPDNRRCAFRDNPKNESETKPENRKGFVEMSVYLTRRYDFPAGHRLHNPAWSDEENARVFRRCNNPNGHGHNYELEVTVAGTPDERLGMVTDLHALDELVQRVILERVDHRNLNVDVDFMQGLIPTAENIVRAMWRELAPEIPPPARLSRLRLVETPNNAAEYWGD